MRTLEPVLIETSAEITTTGGAGARVEMDFDFGNLEGALLERVEYRGFSSLIPALSGALAFALNFDGTVGAFTTQALFDGSRNNFAYAGIDATVTTTGMMSQAAPTVDLTTLKLVIARNISFHIFVVGASTLGGTAAVYFRRVIFDEKELGSVIAFRR